MAGNLLNTLEILEKFNKEWDEHISLLNKSTTAVKSYITSAKIPSTYTDALEKISKSNDKIIKSNTALEKTQKRLQAERVKEIKLQLQREKAFDKLEAAQNREQIAAIRNQKIIARQREALRKTSTEYARLVAKMNVAAESVKNLTAKKAQGIALDNKEQAELKQSSLAFNRYRNAVDKADLAVRKHNRFVGKYPTLLRRVKGSVLSLTSALGLMGGAFLIVQGIRNVTSRIVGFDKAMQNISGILRVSRKDIKDLEVEIIRVAGSSVNTSRDVAKLAENLVTLGKTKKEIKDLLKPVNDLSIGLETSGAEAAEFLVQMLNTFGASTDEAAVYADTIATIRTSTSLDFQRMRDSFQYLAPISKALNKDLAFTGSLIGILSDNGIKAERAGRLLGTAQQKLASESKTLDDALLEINEKIASGANELDVLALSSKLFGKQAAALGLVLANNSDIIEKNAQAIRDNGGALDDLVSEQLESLDAKVKILDSTFEEWILGIENGTGSVSNFFKVVVDGLSDALKGFTLLNMSTSEYNESLKNDIAANSYKRQKEELNALGESAEAFASRRLGTLDDEIDKVKEQIKIQQEKVKAEEESLNIGKKLLQGAAGPLGLLVGNEEKEKLEKLVSSLGLYEGQLKAIEEMLGITEEQRNKDTKTIVESTKELDKNKEVRREKLKAIGFEAKETETLTDIVNKQIKALERTRDLHLKGTKEYNDLTEAIKEYKDALDLTIESENLLENRSLQGRINRIEREREEIEKLEEATENYLKTVASSSLGDLGFDSLNTFFDGTFDNLLKGANTLEEKFAVTFNSISEVAKDAFSIINSIGQENFDAQFFRLEQQRDIAIAFAGESTTARAEIDRQYEEKRKEIQSRQAKAQKDQALFNIGVTTAQGAISAYVSQLIPGDPTSVIRAQIAALIVSGIGAAQIAVVSSQKIPAFKDGVKDFSGGKAWLGDGGVSEIGVTPSGNVFRTPAEDTLYDLPKGTNIYKNEDVFLDNLMKELSINNISPFGSLSSGILSNITHQGISKDDLRDVFSNEISKLNKTINNKEFHQTNFDENGMTNFIVKGNSRTQILNSRRRGKGRQV